MTTNPLRADDLRKRIAHIINPNAFDDEAWKHVKQDQFEQIASVYERADAILALLTPPPSLASVVVETEPALSRDDQIALVVPLLLRPVPSTMPEAKAVAGALIDLINGFSALPQPKTGDA